MNQPHQVPTKQSLVLKADEEKPALMKNLDLQNFFAFWILGQRHVLFLMTFALTTFQFNSAIRAEIVIVIRNVDISLDALSLSSYELDLDLNGSVDFIFKATLVPDPMFTVGFDVVDFPLEATTESIPLSIN